MITLKTIDFQKAVDEVSQAIKALGGNKSVTVGIHEGAGVHEGGEITMAQLGAVMEFGTDDLHIPARPWLVPGVESGTADYLKVIESGLQKDLPFDTILAKVGVKAEGLVKIYMTNLRSPPNAPSTIAKKGSDNPLIDSGALRGSVTSAVQSTPLQEGLI